MAQRTASPFVNMSDQQIVAELIQFSEEFKLRQLEVHVSVSCLFVRLKQDSKLQAHQGCMRHSTNK